MNRYVAFLRGINVGGRTVKMGELKRIMELLGFKNVKTILSSGNVLFDARVMDAEALAKTIENALSKAFGFKVSVIVRTDRQIISLIESMPFMNVKTTLHTKLYVTFIPEWYKPNIRIPYISKEMDFKILYIKDGAVFSVLALSPNTGTVDLMDFLSKEFGREITTRNWNTIERIGKSFD